MVPTGAPPAPAAVTTEAPFTNRTPGSTEVPTATISPVLPSPGTPNTVGGNATETGSPSATKALNVSSGMLTTWFVLVYVSVNDVHQGMFFFCTAAVSFS